MLGRGALGHPGTMSKWRCGPGDSQQSPTSSGPSGGTEDFMKPLPSSRLGGSVWEGVLGGGPRGRFLWGRCHGGLLGGASWGNILGERVQGYAGGRCPRGCSKRHTQHVQTCGGEQQGGPSGSRRPGKGQGRDGPGPSWSGCDPGSFCLLGMGRRCRAVSRGPGAPFCVSKTRTDGQLRRGQNGGCQTRKRGIGVSALARGSPWSGLNGRAMCEQLRMYVAGDRIRNDAGPLWLSSCSESREEREEPR